MYKKGLVVVNRLSEIAIRTSLIKALKQGCPDIVMSLLEAKIVKLEGSYLETISNLALDKGYTDIVKLITS